MPGMDCDYLIVGAGVFGASTALHLARTNPAARIVLVDRCRPNPAAATSDLNKIIRADYPDLAYMKLALEAQELWRTDPIFKPFYHESGILLAEEIGMGQAAFDNYKRLGLDPGAEMLTPEEARARFPVFQEANWDGVTAAFYNPKSGWAEGDAIQSLVAAAIDAGVIFEEGTVARLLLGEDRSCQGVCLAAENGTRKIRAIKTVLCVGAYTAKVLADTAPEWEELQVGDRMVAAAAVQCMATYAAEEDEKFINAPVHLLGMWHTHGEGIPPCEGRLKFNCHVSFTNMTYHDGLKKEISIPPAAPGTFGEEVAEGLKQEAANVVKHMYGSYIRDVKIESFRMCWDAVSSNQDWVIDYHPHCKGLFIAAAGSFHSWKFMPNIGKYIVRALNGELDRELAKKWAWDRSNKSTARLLFIPARDLKSIGPFKGWTKTGRA